MRELLEQGFEVVVVTDATAAAKLPGFDGYEAAYVNFRLRASDVWSTTETVKKLSSRNNSGCGRCEGAGQVAQTVVDFPKVGITNSKRRKR